MSHINTISEFLLHAGTDYRIFDMGRAIRPLNSQYFLDIELGKIPAPYPRQQHAWFGIVFFNPGLNQQHYIWFVKLPVDEQGLLLSAARNQYLQLVVEALGKQLENTEQAKHGLPDNPFTFVPSQQQLADFNSICRQFLGLPNSVHLEPALNYLRDPKGNDWQTLSVQGLAELAAQIAQGQHRELFNAHLEHFANQVQQALCASLENHPIDAQLSQILLAWAEQQAHHLPRQLSVLRALSQSSQAQLLNQLIDKLLSSNATISADMLVLIAARHWRLLSAPELLRKYIELLSLQDTELFIGLYSDLVQIPELRNLMLDVLRWPDKSPQLLLAIEHLFKSHEA